jgi:WD40 repeat protein
MMHPSRTYPALEGTRRFVRLLPPLAVVAALIGPTERIFARQAAAELPTEPILRIEAGQHGALINRIDTDAANRFVVTASDDKTARVWSIPDGQLQRVLRLPIGHGNVGKAYAVAISPDSATIAVGGWTGSDSKYSIFLFDRSSGALKQRLSGLPDVVFHLTYSPDGARLAACLGAGQGIRVYDASNGYRLLPSHTKYADRSDYANFDRRNRLITISDDSFVRLYEADRYQAPVAQFEWKNHELNSAAFSPDGSTVAVGSYSSPEVMLLSGSDLGAPFKVDTSGIDANKNVGFVAWSKDGRFLYAGGTWRKDNVWQVRRWNDGGRGAHVDIPATRRSTIFQLVSLSGSILFVSAMGIGLIYPDANVTEIQRLGVLDLSSGGGRFIGVSDDGGTVKVRSWNPEHTYVFSLGDRQLTLDPPEVDAANCLSSSCRELFNRPITKNSDLKIENWDQSTKPTVNGAAIDLRQNERSKTVAIVPGTQHFALGSTYNLRLIDQQGHNVWPAKATPTEVDLVNITGNRRLIVAAYADGTIRWYRVSDGEELLALFIHPDGRRWVVWTPQGYYDASLGADELIGWHINHGYDRVPDFYPVSQFREQFYRPDVIHRLLQTPNLELDEALRDADRAAGRPTTKAVPVNSLLTPIVQIHSQDTVATDRAEMQLTYSVKLPSSSDSLRVEALIDGVKIAAADQPLVVTGDTRAGILNLTLPRRNSIVSIIAYNGEGASAPASIHVQWRGAGSDPKLTLYVLAIGVGQYKDKSIRPLLAGKDADDFVAFVRTQVGGLYENVVTHPARGSLRDSEATRDAVLDELDWIRRAVTNSNNVAMVFLSGHGVMTPDQHYRFLPYDYDPQRVERTTISDSELADYLTKIGGKKVFFFDTCYSGAILGGKATDSAPNVDKFANELKAAENGVIVFTSSTGKELSQETDDNSVFTKSVIEGLRGKAGRPDIPVITISDLDGYVSRRVKELTNGNQKPMMAMPKTVEDFPISARLQ